jgi:hypothetical protein
MNLALTTNVPPGSSEVAILQDTLPRSSVTYTYGRQAGQFLSCQALQIAIRAQLDRLPPEPLPTSRPKNVGNRKFWVADHQFFAFLYMDIRSSWLYPSQRRARAGPQAVARALRPRAGAGGGPGPAGMARCTATLRIFLIKAA